MPPNLPKLPPGPSNQAPAMGAPVAASNTRMQQDCATATTLPNPKNHAVAMPERAHHPRPIFAQRHMSERNEKSTPLGNQARGAQWREQASAYRRTPVPVAPARRLPLNLLMTDIPCRFPCSRPFQHAGHHDHFRRHPTVDRANFAICCFPAHTICRNRIFLR